MGTFFLYLAYALSYLVMFWFVFRVGGFLLKIISPLVPASLVSVFVFIVSILPVYLLIRHFFAKRGKYLPSFSELGLPTNPVALFIIGASLSFFFPIIGISWLAIITLYGIYSIIANDVSVGIFLKKI